ncbi:MAG: type II secretion system protein [Planctomycetota bacterium]
MRTTYALPRHAQSGFTLVEILIVVVILGVLAAIVAPALAGASREAQIGAFITELKIFADEAEYYSARSGRFLADSSSGNFPPELAGGRIRADDWENGTPLGGSWDVEFDESGITSGVGVHFQGDNPGVPLMADVDARFDDGNLGSGVFQQLTDADRFYWIIAP